MTHELPEVRVVEIQKTEVGEFRIPEDQPGLDLGAYNSNTHALEGKIDSLLGRMKDRMDRCFVLEWRGDKIPYGAVVLGRQIDWAQHGIATDTKGKTIGYYERLVEFGGVERNLQQMLLYTYQPRQPRNRLALI